ncbi:hypothetical protein [Geofilum rubicundum]|uniref:Uncharacterized protein n=1 Tax=Geofilum rubicundum JCM 15548 TaxID=1236989 RepID=A0A0E9M204_9BACT|nr:hypothetical protein [Geofilum rubicundum]GAO31797.1 hypothetical protein JCM15548_14195 [Geofilum rubicundum JCM 15548]
MKTIAKQTGKLNGTFSLMVLGILFLTILPISHVEAGGIADKAENAEFVAELTEPILAVEDWMLEDIDWIKEEIATDDRRMEKVENWMLTPESWESDWHYDVAEHTDSSSNQIDGWMLEPAEWRNDLAGLTYYF